MKLNEVKGFQNEEIKQWCLKNIYPGSTVFSNCLRCFDTVVEAKCIHEVHIVGGGKKAAAHPFFKKVVIRKHHIDIEIQNTYRIVNFQF